VTTFVHFKNYVATAQGTSCISFTNA